MKRFLLLVLISFNIFLLVGCQQNLITTKDDQYLENGFEVITDGNKIQEIRNIETGVHYYMRTDCNLGGLAPVYNSDGTLRITK